MKIKTKKRLKKLGIVLLALVVAYGAIALWPKPQNYALTNPMLKTGDMPMLIAHGGGNKEFPDNTLEAFYNAYSVDPNCMMETDVSITKDGVVILSHDTRLDRKTNVTGNIIDWNYADLMAQKVDFGYTNDTTDMVLDEGAQLERFTTLEGNHVTPLDVPYPDGVIARDPEVFLATTLEELILAFPNNLINVEIKQEGETGMTALKEVIRLLEEHDAFDRVVLASFHDDIYAEYKRMVAAGEVPAEFMFSPSLGGAATFYAMQLLNVDVFFTDKTSVLQLPTEKYGLNLATKGVIESAHEHNIAVQYWTINDPDEMRMLIDLGADGIMTDYPHRLQEVYNSYTK
ncbi:MAG: hypothetical protein IJ418_01115 [Clostridia bacterium]|nr:hypothetical protein [Clostridia bacterium]